MGWAELAVVALSAVPLIENRGAMFFGFAAGVRDPLVYLAGTLANIASIPIWARIIHWLPFPFKEIEARPLRHVPLLVALPYTGINMGSVLYFFPRLFKLSWQEIFPYLAAGIILRGAATYLFFIGLLGFMNIFEVFMVLVGWYLLAYLAKEISRLKGQK
ncbi:MAG: hypothetical protein N3G22_01895 [Candidatus Micrarchaeota archaeon]|nr:hypothetical protein [Candidatus Micrarchaeota archaeon]